MFLQFNNLGIIFEDFTANKCSNDYPREFLDPLFLLRANCFIFVLYLTCCSPLPFLQFRARVKPTVANYLGHDHPIMWVDRICPMCTTTSEMDFSPPPGWTEARRVNTDHVCRH